MRPYREVTALQNLLYDVGDWFADNAALLILCVGFTIIFISIFDDNEADVTPRLPLYVEQSEDRIPGDRRD